MTGSKLSALNQEDKNQAIKDQLILDEEVFHSRLLLGSSNYPDLQTLRKCVLNSKAEIVTVGIRRINIENSSQSTGLISLLKELKVKLLPNTAGCFTAYEAILTAKLAKEALGTDWVKLEVIGDKYSLYPDSEELLIAARELVKANFKVLPYCLDDPIVCQKLRDLGCVAVMPLASPIGSGQGIRNPYNIELIRKKIDIPVIIDAGIGSPKDAAFAMELGADGVLMNTAIAEAKDPSKMAYAMSLAIQAGRLAYQAGRIPEKKMASPSTEFKGKIELK